MSGTSDEDRDDHLLAALRHAPDRDVKPPADLSAAILGRAQAAVQPPQAPGASWLDGWRATFYRLLRPAPMAAFGTVAMATVIGVMWSGQSPPDATPSLRPETMAAAPATADAPPAAQAPVAQRESAPAAVQTRPTVARPPPPAAAEAQQKRAAPEDLAAAESSATLPQPAEPARREFAAKSMADAAPAPTAVRSRAESATAALGAAAPVATSPLTAPTIDFEAAARSDPARVRWHLASGRMAAHDAAQRDWWSALARATQGRWQAAAGGAPAGAQVTVTIDGVPRGSLVFEPNHVVWREPGGLSWRAPIAADTLRDWQEALARW